MKVHSEIWICVATVAALCGGCGVKAHYHDPISARERGPDDEPPPPPPPPPGSTGGQTGGGGGAGGPAPMAGMGGAGRTGGSGGPQPGGTGGMTATGGRGSSGPPGGSGGTSGPAPDTAMPPGSSEPGPNILGTQIPKNKAIVFIHIGHSDMAGRADKPAALRGYHMDTDPRLWVYGKGDRWRAAKEPTAGDAGSVGKSGPGMAILRNALLQAPDGYVISIGHGHSGAQNGYCPNFRRTGLFWPLFMDAAKELKGKVIFGGIFTMFGITEYHLGTPGLRSLADCIAGVAADIRAELGDPNIPLMVGGWNEGGDGIYAPNSEYGQIAVPQIAMVPNKDPRAAVIPTNDLTMQDDRHLDMMGQKVWAERAFAIMKEKGWLPWATK